MNATGAMSVAFAIALVGAASVYGILPRVPTMAHAALSDEAILPGICHRPDRVSCTITLLGAAADVATDAHAEAIPPEICFRPGPISCTALVIKEIDSAARTIDFEAYSLTDVRIIGALNRAATRGVKVRSVVDRESTLAKMLPGEVYTDCTVRIMHNKVVIVDVESVGLGSFNFSYSAERSNAENHIWIHDSNVATAYVADFETKRLVSTAGATRCKT